MQTAAKRALTAERLPRVIQELLYHHFNVSPQVRVISSKLQGEGGENLLQFESALALLACGHLGLCAWLLLHNRLRWWRLLVRGGVGRCEGGFDGLLRRGWTASCCCCGLRGTNGFEGCTRRFVYA